jgi:hypothetical protein
VSYASADRDWAEWIAWQLEEVHFKVLIQAWDFVPGSHYMTQMHAGIRGSDRVIAVLSNAYLDSVYGQAEWRAAFEADPHGLARKVIPVRVEDCPRPLVLNSVVSFDLFDQTATQARTWLLDHIRSALAGRAKPPAEPHFPGTVIPPTAPTSRPRFPGRASGRPPRSADPVQADSRPPQPTPAATGSARAPKAYFSESIDVSEKAAPRPAATPNAGSLPTVDPGSHSSIRRVDRSLWARVAKMCVRARPIVARHWLTATATAAAAVVATTALVLLLPASGGTSTHPEAPSTPAPQGTEQAKSATEQLLRGRLSSNAIDLASCKPDSSLESMTGVAAALSCEVADGSGALNVIQFAGHDYYEQLFSRIKSEIPSPVNCQNPGGWYGSWQSKGSHVGPYDCYLQGGRYAAIAWGWDTENIAAESFLPDADLTRLDQWWQREYELITGY